MDPIQTLFDWLLDGALDAKTPDDVIERVSVSLCDGGVPVDRTVAFVLTLHPNVLGRSFSWEPGSKVKVGELTERVRNSAVFTNSPVPVVMRDRREFTRAVLAPTPSDFPILHELAASGFTGYVCIPMPFQNGEVHAISFATKRAGGFAESDLVKIRHIARPLCRIAEIFALRRLAVNVLSTYTGRRSSEQILAGRISKGDIETIRAAIWFSDMRGFTEMSGRVTARETIDTLNELFECQVSAIDAAGGEVLKFIGDGLLAIFPIAKEEDTAARCASAFDAAKKMFAAIDTRNASTKKNRIDVGLALHVGEIAYGNIGGVSRLDFTAIGPAVNLAARLEGLTSKLGRRIVASEAFAAHGRDVFTLVGEFELKGVAGSSRVFAPP